MEKKVLLVDDEREILEMMRTRIKTWDYEVIIAQGSKEALEIFNKTKPDAVVLDYSMPDINGIELLGMLREKRKSIPAIIFTAYMNQNVMEEGADLEVSAFIPKISPYVNTMQSLRTTLDMIFRKKE